MFLGQTPLILASSSPRRLDLLRQAGIIAQVCPPLSEEIMKAGEKPQTAVKRLAQEKALSVRALFAQLHEASVILAADTLVVTRKTGFNTERILGKPKTSSEAIEMLTLLEGQTHSVWTGYCLLLLQKNQKDKKISRVLQSQVTLRSLSSKSIERYVHSGEPMDKAGGYAAQGLGAALIEKIQGSYTNVVGLPITQVLMDLETLGLFEFLSWIDPVPSEKT